MRQKSDKSFLTRAMSKLDLLLQQFLTSLAYARSYKDIPFHQTLSKFRSVFTSITSYSYIVELPTSLTFGTSNSSFTVGTKRKHSGINFSSSNGDADDDGSNAS